MLNQVKTHYWVCETEKRIYHTKPTFSNKQEKQAMYDLGITEEETWELIEVEMVLQLCHEWKPHYVYSAYSTRAYEIIDCPELLQVQKDARIEGMYIPMMQNVKRGRKLDESIWKKRKRRMSDDDENVIVTEWIEDDFMN